MAIDVLRGKGESANEISQHWVCALKNAGNAAFVPPCFGNIQLARRSRPSTEENVAMAKKEAKKLDELFRETLKDIYFVENLATS